MDTSDSPEVITGTIVMNDISGDRDYDFIVSLDTSKQRPSADANKLVNSHIKKSGSGTLQELMTNACNAFYEEFKQK